MANKIISNLIEATDISRKLGQEILFLLNQIIKNEGHAKVLLSGGNTPRLLYQFLNDNLSSKDNISFGLVDERFVPSNDEKSNENMIRTIFGGSISLDGMVFEENNYAENLKKAKDLYLNKFENPDICILGMGNDGHYASIFPKDKNSDVAQSENSPNLCNTSSPSNPKKRITCNSELLARSSHKFLLITDENKRNLLQKTELNLPIHQFILENPSTKIYYGSY